MEKQKFSDRLKGKGYYVVLFVGVIAIVMVAMIGTSLSSPKNEGDNLVDLNEFNNVENDLNQKGNEFSFADEQQKNNGNTDFSNEPNVTDAKDKMNELNNDELIEFDIYSEADEKGVNVAENNSEVNPETNANGTEAAAEEEATVETVAKTVESKNSSNQINKLEFNAENGLLWPLDGSILMNYSMDSTIYHKTLMLFKCNPAIIIGADSGTKIHAAADGKVTELAQYDETGLTLTIDVGSGYKLVYGQLDDVNLKVGDMVKEGDTIGIVASPTKYYSMEGSNLYFKVLNEDKPINPMTLLRED